MIYASIATEDEQPGIALQYWFFYYFNDFNNLHEGDWEMIQLLFDADSVEEALAQEPVQVAFAQHSGGETADWDAPKLEREGTRPVVYASSGSHASYFGPGLWLGWGQDGSGLGCDVTNGDPVRIDPEVRLIPATITGEDDPFAWVTFSGHWGERETWVYDGPTGPAFKRQWTAPVSWMEDLRADSIRVSAAGIIGPAPSDIFCAAVENGSALFTLFTPYPVLVIGIVAAGLGIMLWALRQSWPTLRETWRVYWPHLRVFAGIGGIMVAATLAVSILQYLLATNPDFAELTRLSEDSPELQGILGAVSLLTRGLLLVIVTPAVVQAVGDIVAGRPPGVRRSFQDRVRQDSRSGLDAGSGLAHRACPDHLHHRSALGHQPLRALDVRVSGGCSRGHPGQDRPRRLRGRRAGPVVAGGGERGGAGLHRGRAGRHRRPAAADSGAFPGRCGQQRGLARLRPGATLRHRRADAPVPPLARTAGHAGNPARRHWRGGTSFAGRRQKHVGPKEVAPT